MGMCVCVVSSLPGLAGEIIKSAEDVEGNCGQSGKGGVKIPVPFLQC